MPRLGSVRFVLRIEPGSVLLQCGMSQTYSRLQSSGRAAKENSSKGGDHVITRSAQLPFAIH